MGFQTIQSTGYFIDFPSKGNQKDHIFCGEHDIRGAKCPNCEKPLLRFATLDLNTKELKFSLTGISKLHLLYCWTCNIAYEWFFYQLKSDQKIEIIKYGKGGCQKDFPYVNYPKYFPEAKATLTKISKRVQGILSKLNSIGQEDFSKESEENKYARPKHQIGGEPYFIQYYLNVECPCCNSEMLFLSSIADDCLDVRGMAGNPFVQVVYSICLNCKVIGVTHDCD